MKKIALIALLTLTAASFTGCGFISAFKEGFKEGLIEAMEENAGITPSRPESSSSQKDSTEAETQPQVCTVGNISFTVDGKWEEMAGYEGAFSSADNKTVYMLQGTSVLGSFTPDEFYSKLIEMYSSESYELTYSDSGVTAITTADGTECFVGRIEMLQENVKFCIDVLIAPDKNTVLTFAAQCADFTTPETDIRRVTETTEFHIGTEDMMTGHTLSISSGSELHLETDGTFRYYEDGSDPDSAYLSGTYEVYYGQAAFDKLVSMTDYGLTEEELERTLAASMNGYSIGGSMPYDYFDDDSDAEEGYHICRDTFYALVVETDTLYENGTESPSEGSVLHLGYYIPELEIFDLVNANTYNYNQWSVTE